MPPPPAVMILFPLNEKMAQELIEKKRESADLKQQLAILRKEKGSLVSKVQQAARQADIIQILTQDHVQAKVYKESIKRFLKKGKALCFSHGFNIRFKQIKPPKDVDVFMVAPKGPGALVRKMYEEGKGVPCLLAVFQDSTGQAKQLAPALRPDLPRRHAGQVIVPTVSGRRRERRDVARL